MAGRLVAVLLVVASLAVVRGAIADDDAGRAAAAAAVIRLDAAARPTPISLPDPAGPRSKGPGRLIERDLRTGKTTIHTEFGPAPTAGRGAGAEGFGVMDLSGDLPSRPGADKNFLPWTPVADPTSGTYPRRVRMWSTYLDSEGVEHTSGGSGTLIDPYHVLTAAHCIYKLLPGGYVYPDPWAQSVTVVPAYHDSIAPFGSARSAQLYAWDNFTIDGDWDHDIALIVLDRPLGGVTGWAGYGYNTDYDYYSSGTWRHEGYPSEDPFDGQTLYENAGTYDETPIDGWDYRIGYFAPTWGGTSGAGATRDGVVYGVFSGSNRVDHTEDVILTPAKFGHIQALIAAVTPAGWDLIPMFVKTGDEVAAGASVGFLNFVLHNYGASWANTDVDYTIHLSADANITASDIYLGSGTFNISLANKHSELIPLPAPVIPSYVAAGNWYVGVILDVADAYQSNNDTSGQEAAPLTVSCAAPPPPPTLTAPSDGAICRPRDNLFLAWGDLGSGDEYEIQLGTVPGTGTITSVSNQTNLQVSGLDASTTYYWRVRCRLGCGSWGPWSAYRSFRTVPNLNRVSSLVDPAEGTHCLTASVALGWTTLPDAASYQVQISPDWCYEGPITTGITGTQFVAMGLTPNTTYYWRVRALTTCGDLTAWSSAPGFCWTFKTGPADVFPPTIMGPEDGATCASALIWNHAEDWDHYEVQLGEACGSGTVYTTTSNGLRPEGLVQGVTYVWRVRTVHECGMVSAWSACRSFTLDQVLPINPTTLASSSHEVGVWSTDNTIDVWWDWGSDDCAGSFPQYATLWDTIPGTEPTVPTTYGEVTLETSPPLADGRSHWFHVRTVDWADNLALETLHLGPFLIDTTPPGAIAGLQLCEPNGMSGYFDALNARWDAAADSTSGVAGYSWVVASGAPAGAVPDAVVETTDQEVVPVLSGPGGWSFGVRAVDRAGNTGPVSAVGQVLHNAYLPEFTSPLCGTQLNEGQTCVVEWMPGGGAAVGRLRYSPDGSPTFLPIAELDLNALNAGAYAWTVPAVETDRALLQLELDYAVARVTTTSRFFTINTVTAAPGAPPGPTGARLVGNYPNPFNPRTTIRFELTEGRPVFLRVHDVAGRLVRTLIGGDEIAAGLREAVWDGTDDVGRQVAAGAYFCRLEAGDFRGTIRMTLVK